MVKEKILVIGASGQKGVELTFGLRKVYGSANGVASDILKDKDLINRTGLYVNLALMNKEMMQEQIVLKNNSRSSLLN